MKGIFCFGQILVFFEQRPKRRESFYCNVCTLQPLIKCLHTRGARTNIAKKRECPTKPNELKLIHKFVNEVVPECTSAVVKCMAYL
jgi:hypothetical protein